MKKLFLIVSLILCLAFPAWAEHPGAYGSSGSTPGGDSGSVQCNASGVLGACINIVDTMTPTFTSVTLTKQPGVAGLMAVYNAATTSTLYQGFMGAASQTESYSYQFPTAEPTAGQVWLLGVPSGASDPNGNKVSAMTLGTPMLVGGTVEKIQATFDYRSAGTAVPVNSIAYVIDVPYAVTSINTWTVSCSASDATGIIIDVFGVTHTLDTLPTATYCGSGTKPNVTNGHQTSATTPVTWNCPTTSFVAHTDLAFKVLTAPTTSQLCIVTLEVTR